MCHIQDARKLRRRTRFSMRQADKFAINSYAFAFKFYAPPRVMPDRSISTLALVHYSNIVIGDTHTWRWRVARIRRVQCVARYSSLSFSDVLAARKYATENHLHCDMLFNSNRVKTSVESLAVPATAAANA